MHVMLAKLTSKNQLTLPKAAVEAAGSPGYFQIEVRAGQLVLTPIRLQRADAVRAKLAQLELGDDDLAAAVAWARAASATNTAARVAERPSPYGTRAKVSGDRKAAKSGRAPKVARAGKPTLAAQSKKSKKVGKIAKAATLGKAAKAVRKRSG